jgi:glycerophosphoryl diester phosphodiesterase
MKKNTHILSVLTLFSLLSASVFGQNKNDIDFKLKQVHNPKSHQVLVAAHRGDWRNYPENSLKGFESAIEMGVDIIEVDLAITKDGVIVIMHDETIDRTTNGKGKPSDYTLSELSQFTLKTGSGTVSRHKIPTLEEVMNLAKGKVLVNLDRSYPYFNEAFEILKKTNTLPIGIFKSDVVYSELKNRYPKMIDSIVYMPVVFLDKPNAREIIDTFQDKMNPMGFELVFKTDTSTILKTNDFIPKNGSKIWINSLWASLNAGHDDELAVDENAPEKSWAWIIDHGATMIQTDRPKQLLEYLRMRKLRE